MSEYNFCMQLVVPREMVYLALKLNHDTLFAGHLMSFKTYAKLRTKYFWTNMFRNVCDYKMTDERCEMTKLAKKSSIAPLLPIRKYNKRFMTFSTDIVGLLGNYTKTGNFYILTFCDVYRLDRGFAITKIDTKTACNIFWMN